MSRAFVLALGLALATTLWGTSAAAAPCVVLVSDRALREADEYDSAVLQQLRGELEAEGFEVETVVQAGAASPADLEAIARDNRCFAAIRFSQPASSVAADVWITDRMTRKTVVRRVDAPGRTPEAARTLALRAVELLRASLLELNEQPGAAARSEEPAVRQWVAPAVQTRPRPLPAQRRFGVWLGGAVITHPAGLESGMSPLAGASWRATRHLVAELRLIMPVLGSASAAAGSADTDQEMILLSLRFDPSSTEQTMMPFAFAGIGAFRLGASGSARPPFQSSEAAEVVAAAALGGGLRARLVRTKAVDFAVALEAGGVFLTPRPVLEFAGDTLAKTGQPLLALSAAAEAAW